MKTRFIQSIFFLILSICCVPFSLHAQAIPDYGTEPMVLSHLPEHPAPHDVVNFKITSYLSNLDNASISWYVNGSRVQGGTGLRTFSTTLGNAGVTTRVEVRVTTEEGKSSSNSITFTPASVDLIYQANSYTPPLYKGKALLTPYETGRVVSIAHFTQSSTSFSPSNLIYTWKKDGQTLANASGLGKNILTLTPDLTAFPSTISLTVSNKDESVSAIGTLNVNPTTPKLLVYLNTPAFGTLYNTAILGNFQSTEKEMNFMSEPYFYSTSGVAPTYSWTMNDEPLEASTDQLLTVRNEGTSTGMTTITAAASLNTGFTTQSAASSFSMKF